MADDTFVLPNPELGIAEGWSRWQKPSAPVEVPNSFSIPSPASTAPDTETDVLKSIKGQGELGVTSDILSLPGTVSQLATAAGNKIYNVLPSSVQTGLTKAAGAIFPQPSERERQGYESRLLGILPVPTQKSTDELIGQILPDTKYEPQTTAGRFAGSVARMAAGSELTGGLAEVAPAMKIVKAANEMGLTKSEAAATAASKIATGIMSGAATGAVAGAVGEAGGSLYDQIDPNDKFGYAPWARILPAMFGHYVGDGINNSLKYFAMPDEVAKTRLAASLADDIRQGKSPMTLTQIKDAIDNGQTPLPLDMAGRNTRALLKRSFTDDETHQAANDINSVLIDRQNQASSNVSKFINDNHGGQSGLNPAQLEKEIEASSKSQIDDAYNVARNHPNAQQVWSPALEKLTENIEFKPAMNKAAALEGNPDSGIVGFKSGVAPQTQSGKILGLGGEPLTSSTTTGVAPRYPNLSFWDQTKINLGDQIENALKNGNKGEARRLVDLKNTLVTELDNAVPEYASARGAYAEMAGGVNAVDAGYKAVRNMDQYGHQGFLDGFSKMSPEQQQALAKGVASGLDEIVNKHGVDSLLSILEDPYKGERVRLAIGDDAYNSLLGKATSESVLSKTKPIDLAGAPPRQKGAFTKPLYGAIGLEAAQYALSASGHLPWDTSFLTHAATIVAPFVLSSLKNAAKNSAESRIADSLSSLIGDPSKTKELGYLVSNNLDAKNLLSRVNSKGGNIATRLLQSQQGINPEALSYQPEQRKEGIPLTDLSADSIPSLPEGVSSNFVDNLIAHESGADPTIKFQGKGQTAGGLGQFTQQTWKDQLTKHFPDLIRGKNSDQIESMKTDPMFSDLQRKVISTLANDNADYLKNNNIPVNDSTVYGVHWFGPNFPTLYNANPSTPIEKIFSPKSKNPRISSIVKNNNLSGMTVGQVLDKIDSIMSPKKENWRIPITQGSEAYPNASGGRIERASGGRASNHEQLVNRLMRMADQAKKATDKTTEPLLDAPDEAIVKALRVANQAI